MKQKKRLVIFCFDYKCDIIIVVRTRPKDNNIIVFKFIPVKNMKP